MKYILRPLFALLYLILCICMTITEAVISVFAFIWHFNTKHFPKNTFSNYRLDFYSFSDGVNVEVRYYKNPWHYLIKKVTTEYCKEKY